MSFRALITNNKTKAEGEDSLPSVSLTPQEAAVLLTAVKQATFKGEYAKEVVALIDKLEKIASA